MTSTLQTLIDQLQHPDANQRSQAVLALGQRDDPRAIEPLVEVLCNDRELTIQEDATWALVRLGPAAVPPLVEALRHDGEPVRHNAAHALGKIGDRRAVEGLTAVLQDESARVRLKASFALGQIGDPAAVPALIPLLNDSQADVQTTVFEVLAGFQGQAVDGLCQALTHPEPVIRESAAGILGDIGAPAALPALLDSLDDAAGDVRLAVVQALAQIGDSRALDPLRARPTDPDTRVQAMVRYALKTL